MTKIKKTDSTSDMEQLEFSYVANRNVKWYSTTLENSLSVFYKVKHALTVGVYP